MPPKDTDVETIESTSCDIYEIMSEIQDLKLEISTFVFVLIKMLSRIKRKTKRSWIFCQIWRVNILVLRFLLILKKTTRSSTLKVIEAQIEI